MKKIFYRTYIFKFYHSSGRMKYYAGMRQSFYENPDKDPYCGSGRVITREVNAFSKSIIKERTWFDHATREEMIEAERVLIANTKEKYGKDCVNIAGGHGDLLKYADPDYALQVNERRRQSALIAGSKPEVIATRKRAQRKGKVWQPDLYPRLWRLWCTNTYKDKQLKSARFATLCRNHGIKLEHSDTYGLVCHFHKVLAGKEQLWIK